MGNASPSLRAPNSAGRPVILPYDGSSVARAALRRAARLVRDGAGRYSGVLLATAGVDPAALDAMTQEARAIAGPDAPLDLHLLHPGDPIGALRRLATSLPDAGFAAPLGGTGSAPWYAAACRDGGRDGTVILFFLTPAEIRAFAEQHDGRPRAPWPVRVFWRARARLFRGLRGGTGPEVLTPRHVPGLPDHPAPAGAADTPDRPPRYAQGSTPEVH